MGKVESKKSKWLFAQPHKSKYAIAIVIILSVMILVPNLFLYSSLESKVDALRGSASMLEQTILNPVEPRASVDYWVYRGLENSKLLNNEIQFAETSGQVNWQNVSVVEQALVGNNIQCKYYSNLANQVAIELVNQQKALELEGIEIKGTSFEPIESITGQLVDNMLQLEATFSVLQNHIRDGRIGNQDLVELKTAAIELTNDYYQARALVQAAIVTFPASDVNIVEPFVLITVLYTIFLLFPWVLLVLFFLRKRDVLVNAKFKLISDLKLGQRSIGEIYDQAFRDVEYIVSLVLLTVINAVLLYFFFYPNAMSGLAQLITYGGGIQAFSRYLVSDASPITFGFIGAYFFVIQMLLRRYFCADLNPNAYNYAVVRMLTVFIFSVFLQLATSYFSWPPLMASAVAFVVGIFPSVGLRWILVTVNKLLAGLRAPEVIDKYPLTKIDGLNTWHEARLLEEKIENVQNLATVSLDDLIINTNFSTFQLIDWVDQALLFMHTKEQWFFAFHSIGVRTATDLLDNAVCPKTGVADGSRIVKIVKAVNSARVNLGSGQARSSVEELKRSVDSSVVAGQKTVEVLGDLDLSCVEASEKIVGVRGQVDLMIAACEDVKAKVEETKKSVDKLHVEKEVAAEIAENFKAVLEADEALLASGLKAREYVDSLEKNKADSDSLAAIRKLVPQIAGASEELILAGEQACESLFLVAASPELTKEIVEAIVISMQKDPNIESIQYFWKH